MYLSTHDFKSYEPQWFKFPDIHFSIGYQFSTNVCQRNHRYAWFVWGNASQGQMIIPGTEPRNQKGAHVQLNFSSLTKPSTSDPQGHVSLSPMISGHVSSRKNISTPQYNFLIRMNFLQYSERQNLEFESLTI